MRPAGALLAAGACVGLALTVAGGARAQADGWFESRPLAEPGLPLHDLSVVDYDSDGDLDIFILNHLATQLLLANDGSGSFQDRLTAANLNETPAFPGWEDNPNVPDQTLPGLYIYRNSGVELRLVGPGNVTGELRFLSPTTVQQAAGAQVALRQDTARQPPRTVADFSMNANSIVRLKSESTALPLEVAIEPPFPIGDVFVGRRRISPTSRQFMLYQRDRHGMAWGDYNRDGFLDVFIVRGGLKGQLAQLGLVGQISDELMLSDGARFRDATTSSGLVKGACRGRGTMPVDVNRDGLLDLFWECHGSNPALYQSNPDGTFSDASTGLMRAGIRGEPLEWLDVNGDGRDELLKLGNNKLFVYRRAGKDRWRKREEVRTRGHDAPGRIAIADYDTDGDPDLFAPSARENTLLVNRSGHFDVRSLRSLGLPRSGTVTASWVDYDNDGDTDLHASPQGIYRRVGARRFRRTGLAAAKTRGDGFASWFDFNNDGAQDLLLGAATPLWHVDLLENQVTANHWLQVELHGPGGEYPAAGATVTVKARGDKQRQWVGQNDGSHTSQGHYRLYFGLGAADAASVKVTWPDGEVQRIGGVGADQIVRITKSR